MNFILSPKITIHNINQMSEEMNPFQASNTGCLYCLLPGLLGRCSEHVAQGDGSSIINNSQAQLLGIYSVEDSANTQEPQEQPIPQLPELPINPNNQRLAKKDNIAHKRLSKILQDCYRFLMKEKVPSEVREYKHKQNYFLMIVTCLEKEGKLDEVVQLFGEKMEEFTARIEKEYQGQPVYLNQLKTLIERHMEALEVFMTEHRPVEASLKILYDYENMRQKHHFQVALREIKELRAELGLP